jgi:hypothetical protein
MGRKSGLRLAVQKIIDDILCPHARIARSIHCTMHIFLRIKKKSDFQKFTALLATFFKSVFSVLFDVKEKPQLELRCFFAGRCVLAFPCNVLHKKIIHLPT